LLSQLFLVPLQKNKTMITREQAKKIGLKDAKRLMEKDNKTLDDVCIMSPKIGKNSWTYREYIEALEQDKCLEDSNMNPIDTLLNYEKYLNKKGRSLLDRNWN